MEIAWAAPLVLDDYVNQVVFPDIMVLEDTSGKLRFADVLLEAHQDRFKPVSRGVHNLGHTRSTWWIRFEIEQHGTTQRILLLEAQNDYTINVFAIPLAKPAEVMVLPRVKGLMNPVYALDLSANQTQQVYVQITSYFSPLSFRLSIAPQEYTAVDNVFQVALLMLAMGGILALAAYNLFLYVGFRESSYLWLVAFIITLCSELALLNGTLYWLVYSEEWYQRLIVLPSLLTIVTALGFFRQLMHTPQLVPLLDKSIIVSIGIGLLLIVLSPVLPITSAWVAGLGIFILIMAVTTTIQVAQRGYRLARSFIYALLVLILSTLPVILMGLGIIANEFYALYFIHFGFLGFVLLLSQTQIEHTRGLREDSERAIAASQAKTEFLATMSHELRTPMNAVVGLGTLLRMTPLNTEQRDYLGKLEVSSRYMMRLIDDILDFSRIEQRGLVVASEPFSLHALLDDVAQLLQNQAQRKGITFECYTLFTEGTWVRGDATRLSQILLNLVGNAIKFTEQGRVTLAVTEQASQTVDTLSLLFEVADTGQGISVEQLKKLFQPFVQGEGNSPKSGGFGLGLVISQRLVEAMGGTLQVESKVGEGSRFYFTLHFAKAADNTANTVGLTPPAPAATPALSDNSSKRILLVDDDELNRFVASHLLTTMGLHVTLASDGQEALDRVETQGEQPFDLVLMDVSMPGVDGYAATRQLRAMGYQFPIIALTAHAVEGERERCEAAGMNDFFTKPFELHELEQMVSKWVMNKERG
ncbi:hybrid sensor histidine kinase/response regulator [Thiothrix caldifontis]|uniref:hybrid sensor histidine kinase/response regulator n=1 Tax=Thiothrix caldifontis TaxID=525918 RepID=UPI0015877DBE|nr:hybrid sensor histidine kinase/response regulator [Thiothrix caldifontis]